MPDVIEPIPEVKAELNKLAPKTDLKVEPTLLAMLDKPDTDLSAALKALEKPLSLAFRTASTV
jgi:hypothetical protein